MAQLNINIPDDMKEWLDNHPEINRSELFRQSVKRKQTFLKGKVSPMVFTATIVGMLMAVSLIFISFVPVMDDLIRALIALIGGVLAVLVMVTYYMEKKDINASARRDNRLQR